MMFGEVVVAARSRRTEPEVRQGNVTGALVERRYDTSRSTSVVVASPS